MTDDKLKQIAEHFGGRKQLDKLKEECQEVIDAIDDYTEAVDIIGISNNCILQYYKAHIVQEIADLNVISPQVVYLLMSENEVAEWEAYKADRTLQRMEKEQRT